VKAAAVRLDFILYLKEPCDNETDSASGTLYIVVDAALVEPDRKKRKL
jgi:hypothetical protein